MTSKLLVLRPQPGCDETAARARSMGMSAISLPLFVVEPIAHETDGALAVDALLVTSANGARYGADVIAAFDDRPIFAVGHATADAVRAAGGRDVRMGGGDMAATIPLIIRACCKSVTHLCGEHVTAYDPQGLQVAPCPVYRSIERPAQAVQAGLAQAAPVVALVHSERAAVRFGGLVPPERRAQIAIAALSAKVAHACGGSWAARASAVSPDDAALLALAMKLCDDMPPMQKYDIIENGPKL